MNKTSWSFLQCLLALFTLNFVFGSEALCQSAGQASLIEGAKKEGKVVLYATLTVNDGNAVLKGFEQKYPFIKAELVRAGSEQLLNRILTEDRIGASAFDVVNVTTINALKKRGLLQPHHSPEASAYPAQFKDNTGYWATLNNLYFVLGYNPKRVSPKDVPKNWEDILDPKWKSNIGMDQEEYEWYSGTIAYWGREKALKFHRALAKQGIKWNRGHTMVAQLMAAGEFDLGIVYAHRTEAMKKAGAPIDWVKTADPIFVSLSPVAVAAKARNPNAAKLLMDFLLSKEGQLLLRKVNRISGRMDVEPLTPEMDAGKLKLVAIDPDVTDELPKYSKEFRKIYFR